MTDSRNSRKPARRSWSELVSEGKLLKNIVVPNHSPVQASVSEQPRAVRKSPPGTSHERMRA